jgi:hypothetical protein
LSALAAVLRLLALQPSGKTFFCAAESAVRAERISQSRANNALSIARKTWVSTLACDTQRKV